MKLVLASAVGFAAANQVVRFDDPKFLLNGIFDDNHLDPQMVYDKFMSGRWCKTLDDFSYPLESDDWTYLEDKPVEKWCKMWRLCRIETKRRELSCNQVNYRTMQARGLNQQQGNFFANTQKLAYSAARADYSIPNQKILAGHVCESEYNETPCLKKTCSCDLQLADKVLNYVVEYYKNEAKSDETKDMMSFAIDMETGKKIDESELPTVEEVEVEPTEQEVETESESETVSEEGLDNKVQEIVQDHAVLVAEHSQLVEDIATFKEKVQEVVEEHAKSTMIGLKDTLAPIDDSLAVEQEVFEETSNTAEVVLEELVDREVEEVEEDAPENQALDQILSMNQFALNEIEEVGQQIEDIQAVEEEVAEDTLSDIAAFNQDFVFEDSITIKK